MTRAPAELKGLSATINEMADRIEALLRTQRAFVADASHQLRSPMTALRLRIENLEGALVPAHESELEPVIAEVDRLSRVVDGLLELARSDGARPAREPVDVALVLAERTDAWQALADERHVALSVTASCEVEPLVALACPGHLEQVLDNLLANAIDATPPGGAVTLSATRAGDHVELHVVDTGHGLSAADRSRAFDRFWRPDGVVATRARASGSPSSRSSFDCPAARHGSTRRPAAASTRSCGSRPADEDRRRARRPAVATDKIV